MIHNDHPCRRSLQQFQSVGHLYIITMKALCLVLGDLYRVIRHASSALEGSCPELHHGQHLVPVLGHGVSGLLPPVVCDELEGAPDTFQGA